MIHQSHRFFTERSTGEMVSRVVSDADAIQAAVSTRMGDLLQESVTLIGLIGYLFYLNPLLAVVSLIGAPLIIVPVVQFGKRLRKTTHKSQERMAEIATLLEETIRGVRIRQSVHHGAVRDRPLPRGVPQTPALEPQRSENSGAHARR